MVENEFKVMLTREQYDKITAEYDWDEVIEQTNYYFDDAEFTLSRRHVTCRVRKLTGGFFLQMKLPNGAAYSRIELEKPLGGVMPEVISAGELRELSGVSDLPEVYPLGALKTTRRVKRFAGGEIDLDMSEYLGKTDYELEIEFTDETAAREILDKLRECAGITEQSEVCQGKVNRFINEYIAQK